MAIQENWSFFFGKFEILKHFRVWHFVDLEKCLRGDSIKDAIRISFSWDDTFDHIRLRSYKKEQELN